ncbi:ferredoxin--NADP reductase [Flavihumibacter cheonanensis]|uniref:flavin reductase family protein n=1 Tax=Flavihumibacter cheonanensis TaxID=1442385 RepID=UPI001EF822C7|nr:iron-sulfur cluster-binding domain-containing protein [Flavihumibacter cheonanensis]MCG7752882.1 iron-sulfur cluster-binding domain-containing protein [Flavihumibacter cheonanensis]
MSSVIPTYTWMTAGIIRETSQSITIRFNPNDTNFSFLPGQFINIHLTVHGVPVVRSYSFNNSQTTDPYPAITVKEVPNGFVSKYLVEHAEKISSWQVSGPFGTFCLDEHALNQEYIVLIGAGSGISPLFSILTHLLKTTGLRILLIYSNKTKQGTIFSQQLERLEAAHQDRLVIWHVITGEKAANQPQQKTIFERLNKLTLKKLLKNQIGTHLLQAAFYICGPIEFIRLADATLLSLQIPQRSIYMEYFNPTEMVNSSITLPESPLEVLLHHYEQTNLLDVIPGKTILEAALEDRIPLPYSCKNGTCGICTAKLLEGQVYMKNNFILSEDMVKDGFVLLCQSHPLDNQVTVDTTPMA